MTSDLLLAIQKREIFGQAENLRPDLSELLP
jgi:hypothetical protein